jgi:hypothetical protein
LSSDSEGFRERLRKFDRRDTIDEMRISDSDSDHQSAVPSWMKGPDMPQRDPRDPAISWQPINQAISPFPMAIAVEPGRRKPNVRFAADDDDPSEESVPATLRRPGWY